MERYKIAALYADGQELDGQTVTVCGWARTIRDMKTFAFIELNDGSCFKNLQVVMDANTLDNYKEIAGQNVGAALIVTGTLVLTPQAKQPLEVKAASIQVEGSSTPDYPLQKKRHTVEYLRTIAHLRPRTNLFSAVFRVRSVVPKHGMVTVWMLLRGQPSRSKACTVTISARVESRPPDRPMTADLARVWRRRVASPTACKCRISSHRAARSLWSAGTKGVWAKTRVSWVSRRGRSK